MSNLPPMNALRAFEAAARRGGFARAAAELNVTPAAVSQQIRNLEEFLGVKLFHRDGRSMELTEAGAAGLERLGAAFELMGEAAEAMRQRSSSTRVHVSAPPAFAAKWLAPRLGRFEVLRPDIELWISADDSFVDLDAGRADLAVRYGAGGYRGLHVERLLGERIAPVCAPGLFADAAPVSAAELARAPLLHDISPESAEDGADWASWFSAQNAADADTSGGGRFDQAALVLEAAAAGRGVALGRRALVHDDVVSGRLVTVIPDGGVALATGYYVITSRARRASPEATAFIDWLKTEAVRFEDELDEL